MDFIYEIPNNLSDEKCEEIIKRFEKDDRKKPGVVGSTAQVRPIKKSLDLNITRSSGWSDIDKYLYAQLGEGLKQYSAHLTKIGCHDGISYSLSNKNCSDTGYQVQKSVIGDYYSWHHDSYTAHGRFLTFLWYLTSHDPMREGGGTAFHPKACGGKVVTPERGKLLIFPATWTYIHMGLPLIQGNPKYIATGWVISPST